MSISRAGHNSPNACFKFTSSDLKMTLLTYCEKKHQSLMSESEIHSIQNQLSLCKTKNSRTSLLTVCEIYHSFLNIELSLNDILNIIKKTDLLIKYKFDPCVVKLNKLGFQSTINISVSKLQNLLYQISLT